MKILVIYYFSLFIDGSWELYVLKLEFWNYVFGYLRLVRFIFNKIIDFFWFVLGKFFWFCLFFFVVNLRVNFG